MQVTTRGIVLHSTKYGDTSMVVKVLTEELGVQALMVKGVRKRHSANPAALFQHLSLVELVFRYREQRELQYLIESRQIHPYSSIPFDHSKSSILLFINELLLRSIREQEANLKLFDFLYQSLLSFDAMREGVVDFHLAFSIKLTQHLGFLPHGTWSEINPYFNLREGVFESISEPGASMDRNCSKALHDFIHSPIDEIKQFKIGNTLRKDLIKYLVEYYQLHLPGFGKMKSLEVLDSLYS